MGFKLKKVFKGVSKSLQSATKSLSEGIKDSPSMFAQIGQLGAAPLQIVAGSVGAGLSAAAPVLEQATGILQANPALAGMLQTGLTGGGWNLGSLIPQAAAGQEQMMPANPGYVAAPAAQPSSSVPVWVWIAAGGAALVGVLALVLFRRKD